MVVRRDNEMLLSSINTNLSVTQSKSRRKLDSLSRDAQIFHTKHKIQQTPQIIKRMDKRREQIRASIKLNQLGGGSSAESECLPSDSCSLIYGQLDGGRRNKKDNPARNWLFYGRKGDGKIIRKSSILYTNNKHVDISLNFLFLQFWCSVGGINGQKGRGHDCRHNG